MAIRTRTLINAALLVAASAGLSGCVYDVGLGYASGGYYDGGYVCDPYGGYDNYYECDYGQGFGNIGFSGGYYDNYYYPGYGIFLFDNVGRRYPMRDHHRRYWGEKRQGYFLEQRGRDREGPNRRAGRASNDQDDRRAAQREGRGRTSSGSSQSPNDVERAGRGRDRDVGSSRRDRRGNGPSNESNIVQPQGAQQDIRTQTAVPIPRAAPTTQPNPSLPRRSRTEGENVRDQ